MEASTCLEGCFGVFSLVVRSFGGVTNALTRALQDNNQLSSPYHRESETLSPGNGGKAGRHGDLYSEFENNGGWNGKSIT